jgi:hypothetical protein
MTRNEFLRTAGGLSGLAARPLAGQTPAATALENHDFELTLEPQPAMQVRLRHKRSGVLLAGAGYSYSFGTPAFERVSVKQARGATVAVLTGRAQGALEVEQRFELPDDRPWIEEQIRITNRGRFRLALPYGRCGFVLPLRIEGERVEGPLAAHRFTAVPYRREPTGNRQQYADYSLAQVLTAPRLSGLRNALPVDRDKSVVTSLACRTGVVHTHYSEYASEAWVLTDGKSGFLISKYSQDGMEWALIDRVPVDEERLGLRWGGFGIFEGDPEHGAWLAAGESYTFGVTRLTAFEGGINEGFYAFRSEMESRGQGCPPNFNPPAHWNELYDNRLWSHQQDDPADRKRYYQLADMKLEAAKARDYHCEALYMDPGWDTNFASKIWDVSRLGPMDAFAEMLRRDYGLSLSLHTPMAGWCNPGSYDRSLDRMRADGSRVEGSLCAMSRQYGDETFRRLDALAGAGARFFMFDGTIYSGECWDPAHGHELPARTDAQVRAMNGLARRVHRKHPDVLIEMHDQLLGGTPYRHVPAYLGYGESAEGRGFDTVWAFELMWDPMSDLAGGHSIALYYYNLAYSIPLYIHIDLRSDNGQALMLWWNISTCRHLGLGGSHKDPAVRKVHQDAMAAYRRLKPLFASGVFYGIDEETHVHRERSGPRAVVNCFNLAKEPTHREIQFQPERFGLDPARRYRIAGGATRRSGNRYTVEVAIPAYGHTLLEVEPEG